MFLQMNPSLILLYILNVLIWTDIYVDYTSSTTSLELHGVILTCVTSVSLCQTNQTKTKTLDRIILQT